MDNQIEKLEAFVCQAAGAKKAKVTRHQLMSGGAIQENWLVDFQISGGKYDGLLEVVVRKDAPSSVAFSHSREQEYDLLRTAFAAGVKVPEPLWFSGRTDTQADSFFFMRRVRGTAAGHRLVRDKVIAGDDGKLACSLGRELAKIHAIDLQSPALSFLARTTKNPAAAQIKTYETWLETYNTPHPVLYWAITWLKEFQPQSSDIVLCHNDFRTGNYMVENGSVTGVLDWEFAGLSDRHADIGWFCAPCWRFGANEREAGGIGRREDFYQGYESQSGVVIDRRIIRYWEVMATLRWAVIALQQAQRHITGEEVSLELALTGYMIPELEQDILNLTREAS